MSRMTIVATYKNQATAEKVIQKLKNDDYARQDMGLAVNSNTDEALLAVTVDKENLNDATNIMEEYDPNTLVARQRDWRRDDGIKDLHPNADHFIAVELKDKD